jgi:hypothetical protein
VHCLSLLQGKSDVAAWNRYYFYALRQQMEEIEVFGFFMAAFTNYNKNYCIPPGRFLFVFPLLVV